MFSTTRLIWEALDAYMQENGGAAPTLTELAHACSLTDASGASRHVQKLYALGILDYTPRKARSIRLLVRPGERIPEG